MTIIPDKDLQSALNSALYDAFPDMPIAWENTNYTPAIGTTYLRVWLMLAESDLLTLGQSPWMLRQGIFQVSVFAPIGIGFGTAKGKAAEIVAAFKASTAFVYNGLSVTIEKSWVSGGIIEDEGWYHIPVSIRFRSYFAD